MVNTNYLGFSNAIEIAEAVEKAKASKRTGSSGSYKLFYSNNAKQPEGSLTHTTIKALISEFKTLTRPYKYAVIVNQKTNTMVRRYNSDVSRKFKIFGERKRKK